ncbi:hypothetical protein [Mesorhizobium sp. 8]|uniref:hypothetical protein n=1 Tax=Mesorhizobium sp. 8 TaxID=2584466 RepID=UPI001124BC2A|nr:hypothetical protein [Mesorhizobium sp. 8]QDC00340.1 hypothetical protein FGU64_07885 [Mesorhizobium sp. 8]
MTIVNDYVTGTVSIANGDTAVTGVGTAWAAADIRPGDMFMRDGYGVVIASVTDNTHLTLAENWPGVTLAGSAYRIRFQSDGSRYTAAARALVERQANGNLDALAALTGATNVIPMFTGPGAMVVIPKTDLINGVSYDVQVDELADRAAYDGEATGFAVLVSDIGDGRSALYSKASLTSGDWSDPAFITGPVGPLASIAVGATTTLAPGSNATVANSGTATAPVLDFGIPAGEGFYFRGAYAGGTAYVKDDVVTYNGSSYIALQATTGNLPTNATYWGLLALKGTDGTGIGDVVGPSSSDDASVALFDGTTGKAIKEGPPLQTSAVDTTSGAILTIGAFGLGSSSPTRFTGDVDTILVNGWRAVDSTATNLPVSTQGILRTDMWDNNAAGVQTFMAIATGLEYRRYRSSSTWGTWKPYALSPSGAPDAVLEDQKASGVMGGTGTALTWVERELNTKVRDPASLISLSSNHFTTSVNGFVQWRCPAQECDRHRTRLFNLTDGDTVSYGSSAFSRASTNSDSVGLGAVQTGKTYRLEHMIEVSAGSSDFGVASGFTWEAYSQLLFWRTS